MMLVESSIAGYPECFSSILGAKVPGSAKTETP
jgi:hypothetical protein